MAKFVALVYDPNQNQLVAMTEDGKLYIEDPDTTEWAPAAKSPADVASSSSSE